MSLEFKERNSEIEGSLALIWKTDESAQVLHIFRYYRQHEAFLGSIKTQHL